MDICLAFRWRLLHWRAAFGFRGEKVLVSVFEVRSLTYPPLSSVSVCLCFPSVFLSLSLPRMPLLAGGFVCFMPQREPSCTDVLPGLQFLAFAWSSPPSRTTGPDEELWKLHLAASYSTWGFCPQTSPPLHLPLPHPECSFEIREAARRGNPSSLWPRALRLTLAPKWKNVHSTTRVRWSRDLTSASIEKLGEEYSAHPFVLIIHHPGACWKIIYCTRSWLTTKKLSLRACLISPPP